VQDNIWTFIFDPYMREIYQKNNIHFQAYNVMNGIVQNYNHCPYAHHSLEYISKILSSFVNATIRILLNASTTPLLSVNERHSISLLESANRKVSITPTQLILSWLVQQNVSIIPRSSNIQHINENSPMSLYPFVAMWRDMAAGTLQTDISSNNPNPSKVIYKRLSTLVQQSIKALLQNHDLQPVDAVFDNTNNQIEWKLYWLEKQDKEHLSNKHSIRHLISTILPNDSFHTGTHPGHTFIAVQTKVNNTDNGVDEIAFTISAIYGEQQIFTFPSSLGTAYEHKKGNQGLDESATEAPSEDTEGEEL
jgi:hypothetical protein